MLKKSIQLPNGCWCSPMTVYPANWETKRASTKQKWYFTYRFYDPDFKGDKRFTDKKGKFVGRQRKVASMNGFEDLETRQRATRMLLEDELFMLQQGYNLITEQYSIPASATASAISEHTPFTEALWMAYDKMIKSPGCMEVVKSVIRYSEIAIKQLNLSFVPIKDVKRKHIKMMLEQLSSISKIWTPATFNRYRAHLSMVFNELLEHDAIEANPIFFIKKQRNLTALREVLTESQRHQVDCHLKKIGKTQTSFRLFLRIFYHSGARLEELLDLKVGKVDLGGQYFIVKIKKGSNYREVKKTIPDVALRYWKLLLNGAAPGDHVFSNGLVPGATRINRKALSTRWKRNVKEPLGITADLYSLKHSRSTEASALHGPEAAAAQNSHTSTAMVVRIYDVKAWERNHQQLKKVDLRF